MNHKLIYCILGITIVILSLLFFKSCKDVNDSNNLLSAVQDTLRITKDKEGRQTGTIAVLIGSVSDLEKTVKSQEETIIRMQVIAKKNGRRLVNVTAVNIDTKDTSSGKTVVDNDLEGLLTEESKNYIYPVYRSEIVKPWASYKLYMDKDSSNVISNVKNKLDFTQVYENPVGKDGVTPKKGFWLKKKLVAKVTTLNPNTGIDEMHSFHVKEGKKYTGAKIAAGVILGIVTGFKLAPR